ncbi:unnamed protein product [Pleuronectes platessa]|uniref:Uncharacterized protein n=1 Tax=Pleuronectes platessa TaxID=8262 RepID=A0A9N7U9V8_PLEPL|nr:unnamed protein product [Pleuronectes platessa]
MAERRRGYDRDSHRPGGTCWSELPSRGITATTGANAARSTAAHRWSRCSPDAATGCTDLGFRLKKTTSRGCRSRRRRRKGAPLAALGYAAPAPQPPCERPRQRRGGNTGSWAASRPDYDHHSPGDNTAASRLLLRAIDARAVTSARSRFHSVRVAVRAPAARRLPCAQATPIEEQRPRCFCLQGRI